MAIPHPRLSILLSAALGIGTSAGRSCHIRSSFGLAAKKLHNRSFQMKRRTVLALTLAFMGVTSLVRAEDKPNPTGTWKWSVTFNDQSREMTLKLKLEGDKLTGTMPGRNNQETAIEDATFKDGEVAFSVTRERN